MRLVLSIAAAVLSITALITPSVDAAISVEARCTDVNHRYKNAGAACLSDLHRNKKLTSWNEWCFCQTSGPDKWEVARALDKAVDQAACRGGVATRNKSEKLGYKDTSAAEFWCLGLDNKLPHYWVITKPSKPEGGVEVTQFLLSESSEFSAVLQSDGNIVVKRRGVPFWWMTDVPRSDGPFTAVLERDGRFCVSNRKGDYTMCSHKKGATGSYYIEPGNDGHLCIRGSNAWCSGKYI